MVLSTNKSNASVLLLAPPLLLRLRRFPANKDADEKGRILVVEVVVVIADRAYGDTAHQELVEAPEVIVLEQRLPNDDALGG